MSLVVRLKKTREPRFRHIMRSVCVQWSCACPQSSRKTRAGIYHDSFQENMVTLWSSNILLETSSSQCSKVIRYVRARESFPSWTQMKPMSPFPMCLPPPTLSWLVDISWRTLLAKHNTHKEKLGEK